MNAILQQLQSKAYDGDALAILGERFFSLTAGAVFRITLPFGAP